MLDHLQTKQGRDALRAVLLDALPLDSQRALELRVWLAFWRRAGPAIPVGNGPGAIAITPDGKTAYVANLVSGMVTPITIATGKPGPAIRIGKTPFAIAIAP